MDEQPTRILNFDVEQEHHARLADRRLPRRPYLHRRGTSFLLHLRAPIPLTSPSTLTRSPLSPVPRTTN